MTLGPHESSQYSLSVASGDVGRKYTNVQWWPGEWKTELNHKSRYNTNTALYSKASSLSKAKAGGQVDTCPNSCLSLDSHMAFICRVEDFAKS